uniref:SCAN box domain-containing protein n=1 Tax=Latimeria chalumnae TaxID=7897 RepID=H3A874_LATCH
ARVLQEANRAQREAAVVQLETNRLQHERTNQLLEAQHETNQILVNQATQNKVEIQELRQMLNQIGKDKTSARPIRASLLLQKMTPEDDIEAYLLAFERCAERKSWPRKQWAGTVAPFLVGDAQKAYFDLEPEAVMDYSTLKAKILARAGVTPTVQAQRFHLWSYQEGKAPRSQMFDLIHLTQRWLQPENNSAARIVELVVMDRYLHALPSGIRKWVGQGDPSNTQELIALVERQIAAEELVKTTSTMAQGGAEERSRTVKGLMGMGGGKQQGSKDITNGKGVDKMIRCYRCNKPGHIAIQSPMNKEPIQCREMGDWRWDNKFIRTNGKETVALIDSGSTMTLISTSLIRPSSVNQAKK